MTSAGTYPQDYNFIKCKPSYLIGMSVPPIMTAQIADRVYDYWLAKINKDHIVDANKMVGKKV